jgi:hypothetical protein
MKQFTCAGEAMSLAFWKISRNGRWSSPRRSPPAAAASCSGEAEESVDRNGSPLGLNSGDGAPAGPAAEARATSTTAPPRACRGRGSVNEGGEAAGDGYGVGRRMERNEEAEAMVAAEVLSHRGVKLGGVGVDNLVGEMSEWCKRVMFRWVWCASQRASVS